MQINPTSFYKNIFILSARTLSGSRKCTANPYRMKLKDLDPKAGHQSVPYIVVGQRSWHGQPYYASTYITRSTRTKRVTGVQIGCQKFEGKAAQAIVTAARQARLAEARKKIKKSK